MLWYIGLTAIIGLCFVGCCVMVQPLVLVLGLLDEEEAALGASGEKEGKR